MSNNMSDIFSCIINLFINGFKKEELASNEKELVSNDPAINRFISRFHPNVDVTIKNVIENSNMKMRNTFHKLSKNKKVKCGDEDLELLLK